MRRRLSIHSSACLDDGAGEGEGGSGEEGRRRGLAVGVKLNGCLALTRRCKDIHISQRDGLDSRSSSTSVTPETCPILAALQFDNKGEREEVWRWRRHQRHISARSTATQRSAVNGGM